VDTSPGHLAAHAERPETVPLPPGPYELRVADLRIRWPDGEPDGQPISLGDVELLLPPGRRTALVTSGRVGASALAAVLLGFADYEGSVTLNGVELRDLAGDDVRTVIGLCARDTRLLGDTVADNVRIARPDATDHEVAGALRRAGLDLVPEAAAGDLGAAGRQRLALARALLAGQPVLIVEAPEEPDETDDEADGEAGVLAGLLSAAEDRTLLLVSHRPVVPGATPILRHLDEVVTLSGR
jgi:ATP-binding cassette, subfamily C, bacterial CydC